MEYSISGKCLPRTVLGLYIRLPFLVVPVRNPELWRCIAILTNLFANTILYSRIQHCCLVGSLLQKVISSWVTSAATLIHLSPSHLAINPCTALGLYGSILECILRGTSAFCFIPTIFLHNRGVFHQLLS